MYELKAAEQDTTGYEGGLVITPPFTREQTEYLQEFAFTRRMKRKIVVGSPGQFAALCELPDPKRIAVGLSFGEEGAFYTGHDSPNGDDFDHFSVAHPNQPPAGQPSVSCQWTVSHDGDVVEWDGGEKFHTALEWLQYLIETFYKPWGRRLDGVINLTHCGVAVERIVVRNNEIIAKAINDGSPSSSRDEDQ